MNAKHIFLLALCGSLASAAHAQWQWLDNTGRKVFSDRPPPPSIPAQNVLAKPAGAGVTQAAPPATLNPPTPRADATNSAVAGSAEANSQEASTDRAKRTGVDPELEEKKAALDAEEAQKKQAEEKKVALQRKENCERAKLARSTMQSGQMLTHINSKGERGFMDEATRQKELNRFNQTIASDCN